MRKRLRRPPLTVKQILAWELTPREMPRPFSHGQAEGQAGHAGSASAPICYRQALNERQGGYRCLAGRTGITSV